MVRVILSRTVVCFLLVSSPAYAETIDATATARPSSGRQGQGIVHGGKQLLQYPGYNSDSPPSDETAGSLPYYGADTGGVYWDDDDFLYGADDGSSGSSTYPLLYTPPFASASAYSPPQASPPPQQYPSPPPPQLNASPPPPSPQHVSPPPARPGVSSPTQAFSSPPAQQPSPSPQQSPLPQPAMLPQSPPSPPVASPPDSPQLNSTPSASPSPRSFASPHPPPSLLPAGSDSSAGQSAEDSAYQEPLEPLPPLRSPGTQNQTESAGPLIPPSLPASPAAQHVPSVDASQPPTFPPATLPDDLLPSNTSLNSPSFSYDMYFNSTKAVGDDYNCTNANIEQAVKYANVHHQPPEVANNATARAECNLLEHNLNGYPVDWAAYLKPKADGNYDCSDPALEQALTDMQNNGISAIGVDGVTVGNACDTLQSNHMYNQTVQP